MKTIALLLLFFMATLAQNQPPPTQQPPMVVGQILPGRIDPTIKNQNLHRLKIQKLERKYLFIRLSTYDTNKAAIGLYENLNGSLIFSCMDNAYDTCYIPVRSLNPDTLYTILVMSNLPISYNIYTYWGNLEHLKPDQQIKFMFDEKDRTQLFHLQLENQTFEQIRILLRPETLRNQGDSLKIFAKAGLKEEPTQTKYDFKSIHVWNDIEAIFINKQEIGDKKGLGVYIVGNAKTVYILSCEFIRQKIHNLNLDQNIYEYINSQKQAIYHMKLDSQQIDIHVIRFSVFTGEAKVGFFYDKEMKNQFKQLPFQYMSDLQFHIQKSDLIQGTNELYMRVRALDTSTTFQLNMQGRRKSESFQIFQNVFEFVPIRGKQSMYFYSHVWDQSQYDRQKQQTFDVSVIKVEGEYTINFYICKKQSLDQETCKRVSHQNLPNNAQKLSPTGSSEIGSKNIYSIQIKQNQYKRINNVQKRALVIIQIISKNQNKLAFAAIQFSNTKKVRILREGRAFQDKVALGQVKYYKYENINLNVSMIKIHINQISGLTQIKAYRTDSRSVSDESEALKLSSQEPNTLIITQNITKPIFIKILGIVSSIFTVTVNPVHKDHPLSSSLIMAEDIEYDIKLLPYQYTNIQIHPIEQFVVFQFSCEGGSIIVCQINSQDRCKQNTKVVKNKDKIEIDSSNRRELKFRLANNADNNSFPKGKNQLKQVKKPTTDLIRTVKVTLLYHANGKKHCQQRKVNNVYSEIVKSGSCFKFPLPLAQDIQILSNRENLIQSESKLQFYLCSKKINMPEFISNRYRISGNSIAEKCKDLLNDILLTIVVIDETAHKKQVNQYRMEYTVEYNNDIITLIDGVAYFVKTSSSQQEVRTFFYDIIDEQSPVQIELFNKKGNQQFFVKVVNKIDRYNNKINEAKTTLNSVNINFFSNPTISISAQDIAKSKCRKNCVLIISVFSKQKPGTDIQFGIQVTQHQIILKQNQIRNDFLGKGSFKYYQYHSRNTPTDLLFKISDNNRRCAKSYLSNHPYPSQNNYVTIEQQGSLTYKNANKGRYYFAVQAKSDCPYTISVSEGKSILTKIEHSQYYDINLKQNQQEWFYLKHFSKSSFKITSLLKFGSVDIYVNSTQLNIEAINAVSSGKIQSQQFKFKNQYKNSLTINSDQKDFCFNCYYLVNIKAKVVTEGSIFLGSEASKIQLAEGKIFFDEIKENQTTLAIFYKVSQGNILVNVYSGKIIIQMKYEGQVFERSYISNKKVYNQSYKFERIPQKYTPIQIKISAQAGSAVYSLQLLPKSQSLTDIILYPGESKMLKMQKNVNACFTGTLRSKKEQILVIADSEENINLKEIKTDSKLDNKQAQIRRQIIGNILSIKFDIIETFFPEAIPYSICLSSNETKNLYQVTFLVIQTQSMNLLPSDTELIVRNESLFTIHHTGYVIVDIFECDGKAQLIYGSSPADLSKKSTHFLDIIGIPGQNHAIKVESKEVFYLKVNVGLGALIWMPVNQNKERGVGYFKYSIGKIGYSSSFNTIQFKIGGIFKSKQTNTSVQSAKYTLYVSNSRELLQRGVMCQIKGNKKMLQVSINSNKVGQGVAPQITASVQKKKFTQIFDANDTIYFNVVADMILNPPNQDQQHQHYRFVYFEQIVLAELLRQNSIQNLDIKWLIALVIVASASLIAVFYVLVKFVVPALGKLKGRVLVQENNEEKQVNLQAPPSSDRNRMQVGTSQTIK